MPFPVIDLKFRARYAETDQMGVIYYSNYLVWFEMGRAEYCRQMGFSYASLETDGYRLMVADVHCRYKSPARYDDTIRVETTIRELKKKTLTFDYKVFNDATERLLAQGYTKHVCTNHEQKLVRLPDTFVQCMTQFPHDSPKQ